MDLGAQPAERTGTALGVVAERDPLRVRLYGAARRGSREDEGRTRGAPVRAAQRPGSRVGACPGARTRPHPPASRGLERAALDVESAERTGTNVGVLAVANLYAPGCVQRCGRGGRTEDGRAASPQHATHRVTRRRVSRCEGATARRNAARNKRAGHVRGRGAGRPSRVGDGRAEPYHGSAEQAGSVSALLARFVPRSGGALRGTPARKGCGGDAPAPTRGKAFPYRMEHMP